MPTDHFRYGGGATETVLHPIVLVAMFISIILILLLPRKYVIVPLLFGTFLIPAGQEIFVAGVHVFVLRIIVLAGWVRLVMAKRLPQSNFFPDRLNSIDKSFLLWTSFHVVAFTLLYLEMAAVINQIGFLWDALGGFFLLRFLIRDKEDINRAIKCLAYLAVILAIGMVREQLTGRNIFGLLGGVRLVAEIRGGRIRSQALFQHPLLAGTFGATAVPFFVWLWKSGKSKFLSVTGVIASTVMAVTSASSTPVLVWMAAIGAVCFWPFRKRMRLFRWGIVVLVVSLFLLMKAPVWFLIAHIHLTGGSSSYHRAVLVDQFIRHFGDWWLLGTNNNQNWGSDMWDTSNRYVEEGETGGLAAFVCFLAVITWSFVRIGIARARVEGERQKEWLLWLLGAVLFAHTVAFFGISYFDQTEFVWFASLAMISAATAPILAARPLALHRVGMASASPRLVCPRPSPSGPTTRHILTRQIKRFNFRLVSAQRK